MLEPVALLGRHHRRRVEVEVVEARLDLPARRVSGSSSGALSGLGQAVRGMHELGDLSGFTILTEHGYAMLRNFLEVVR